MSQKNQEIQPKIEEPGESEEEDLPVVLQCSQCNVVLGDSMSWVSTNDELKSLTLHSVSSMAVKGKQLVTSTEGIDLGSTYLQLQCKSCKEVIGRIYRTTPRELDELRDLFTLSITKITSYQVGSAEQTSGIDESLDIPTAKELKASIMKTQLMVCTLNERMLNIEKAMEMEGEEEEEEEEETKTEPTNGKETPNGAKDSDSESEGSVDQDTDRKSGQRNKTKQVKGGRKQGSNMEETEDCGSNLQVHAGKRGKQQAAEHSRNSKRTRFK